VAAASPHPFTTSATFSTGEAGHLGESDYGSVIVDVESNVL
jgi:hypothetical protein